ncbi:hypothetical protein ACFWAR_14745 [Streptomyces sp. NPDC059917]|uniref:hypothetical protein n=1 Tax=Streptomyces sp. NPDC059917 TaxID=3347002 RepID=UPI00364A0C5B
MFDKRRNDYQNKKRTAQGKEELHMQQLLASAQSTMPAGHAAALRAWSEDNNPGGGVRQETVIDMRRVLLDQAHDFNPNPYPETFTPEQRYNSSSPYLRTLMVALALSTLAGGSYAAWQYSGGSGQEGGTGGNPEGGPGGSHEGGTGGYAEPVHHVAVRPKMMSDSQVKDPQTLNHNSDGHTRDPENLLNIWANSRGGAGLSPDTKTAINPNTKSPITGQELGDAAANALNMAAGTISISHTPGIGYGKFGWSPKPWRAGVSLPGAPTTGGDAVAWAGMCVFIVQKTCEIDTVPTQLACQIAMNLLERFDRGVGQIQDLVVVNSSLRWGRRGENIYKSIASSAKLQEAASTYLKKKYGNADPLVNIETRDYHKARQEIGFFAKPLDIPEFTEQDYNRLRESIDYAVSFTALSDRVTKVTRKVESLFTADSDPAGKTEAMTGLRTGLVRIADHLSQAYVSALPHEYQNVVERRIDEMTGGQQQSTDNRQSVWGQISAQYEKLSVDFLSNQFESWFSQSTRQDDLPNLTEGVQIYSQSEWDSLWADVPPRVVLSQTLPTTTTTTTTTVPSSDVGDESHHVISHDDFPSATAEVRPKISISSGQPWWISSSGNAEAKMASGTDSGQELGNAPRAAGSSFSIDRAQNMDSNVLLFSGQARETGWWEIKAESGVLFTRSTMKMELVTRYTVNAIGIAKMTFSCDGRTEEVASAGTGLHRIKNFVFDCPANADMSVNVP